ncbi:hypothetical protein OH146_06920 [Salinibacterium sp. SYSU T00001]|nr:hypothetical protein [Salinibacterium sedimenticola]MCW4385502.1 hypothetical protein [Salinibacterium sedimenticola]
MITSLLALAAIALWASIAALETVARDGYGRLPDLAVVYYPLP